MTWYSSRSPAWHMTVNELLFLDVGIATVVALIVSIIVGLLLRRWFKS